MKVAIRVFFCCLVVLLFCDFVVWLIANIAKKQRAKKQHPKSNEPTKQRANKATKSVWKTVPSVARVTRDEVSGLQTGKSDCLEDSTKLIAFTLQYHSYYLLIS